MPTPVVPADSAHLWAPGPTEPAQGHAAAEPASQAHRAVMTDGEPHAGLSHATCQLQHVCNRQAQGVGERGVGAPACAGLHAHSSGGISFQRLT